MGPPGVQQECWVRSCEGASALGMRAGDGGTQLSDLVRSPPATGIQMGLPALSESLLEDQVENVKVHIHIECFKDLFTDCD